MNQDIRNADRYTCLLSSLRKARELEKKARGRTPFEAVEKWYEMNPPAVSGRGILTELIFHSPQVAGNLPIEIKTGFFYQHPLQFKVKVLLLLVHNNIVKPDSFPIINTYFGNSTSFYL